MDISVSTVQADTLLRAWISVQVEGKTQPPVLARGIWMVGSISRNLQIEFL